MGKPVKPVTLIRIVQVLRAHAAVDGIEEFLDD